ncbi:bacterial proteasome activator family protein [Pseudokineococcus marinus]|nr:bacterial proteasome activator family protein [Pseudokineococcus marinus]
MTQGPQDGQGQRPGPDQQAQDQQPVVVMTQQGMGVAGGDAPNPAEQVERPDKVMRIGSMVKQLLDEVRSAPLDDKGRARLAEVHQRSLAELEDGLAPDLVEELRRISLPFSPDEAPSDAELRIAQAQLVGWLEGLFHGIQTAVFAQQMAARAQLEQMRRALPGGQQGGQGAGPGGPVAPVAQGQPGVQPGQPGTGQYL